ncbi:MAG: hypothetical protein A3J24_05805 [Deltaproteobacteria bacterium RIFCSPLOWO2_02_FULL_53_8]|nr:MAG: hypothetical protein A3J24_05805 [Deltaproteobacteria bacterium RIFCSPLOWO2_02_FULL_53_8]
MSSIEKRLGSRITEARLFRKLTQSELAEMIDVSVETISRIERGVSFPSIKTVEKIAVALKLSLKTLFECEDEQFRNQSSERELAKLVGLLRTLDKSEIIYIHKIIKAVCKNRTGKM